MALTRRQDVGLWNPFRELEDVSQRLTQLFAGAGEGSDLVRLADWAPKANVRETDKAYEIEAELPQVAKEDIHLKIEEGVMSIEGERKDRKEEKTDKLHRIESSYGKFLRRFALPNDAVADKIEATSKDGMLTVRIPKGAPPKPTSKEVPIR
jgi:HSP20 family protein